MGTYLYVRMTRATTSGADQQTELSPRCPIRTSLDLLGGKWRLLLIHRLAGEPMRYSQLRRALPDISEKMLTQELKALVQDRLVERIDHETDSPRIEYRLTRAGRSALPVLKQLHDFADGYERMLHDQA